MRSLWDPKWVENLENDHQQNVPQSERDHRSYGKNMWIIRFWHRLHVFSYLHEAKQQLFATDFVIFHFAAPSDEQQ